MYQATVRNSGAWDGTLRSDWNFDTIRTTSAMGSFRSMAKDLADITGEDEYAEDGRSLYDVPESVDSSAATKGSDLASSGIAMNSQAGHSTVVIRSFSGSPAKEKDIPELLAETASTETGESTEPSTPPQGSESPPAYSASVRSSRRSSYAARNNVVTGTVIGEADLGTGVDTIRPVKKVDTVRSLRLSSEYVGSLRSKEGSESSPVSPTSPGGTGSSGSGSGKAHRRGPSEIAKAGKAMVDDVLLPIFEKVRVMTFLSVITLRVPSTKLGCKPRCEGPYVGMLCPVFHYALGCR